MLRAYKLHNFRQTATDGGETVRLKAAHAIYREGTLVFADPEMEPEDGTEVVVTFFERLSAEGAPGIEPILALRGRGKGERLVEKLMESRRQYREGDEQSRRCLRS